MVDIASIGRVAALSLFAGLLAVSAIPATAYDGTKCKAPGNCWEPKPGYPDQVAGSKYDPKHEPKELNKQSEFLAAMADRNAKRVAHFKKTGKWEYYVAKIPN